MSYFPPCKQRLTQAWRKFLGSRVQPVPKTLASLQEASRSRHGR